MTIAGSIVYCEQDGTIHGWGTAPRDAWVFAITHIGNNNWPVLRSISEGAATKILLANRVKLGWAECWSCHDNTADVRDIGFGDRGCSCPSPRRNSTAPWRSGQSHSTWCIRS